jgi:putative MATE family efflux protein
MIGNLAQTVINITDSVFLGKVGQLVFDASAIAGLLYFVFYMIGYAFSIGAQILIARKAGENKDQSIGVIFDNSIYLLLLLSVLLFVLLKYVCPPLLSHALQSPAMVGASQEYLFYRALGIPFAMINLAFRSFFVGIGQTRILTWNLGLMAIVNILFCYLLIFGNYGFPEMGIGGAALASTIAEGLALLFFLVYTFCHQANKKFNLLKFKTFDLFVSKTIVKLSLPMVLQHIFSIGGWLVFFIFIENLGPHQLAISNLVRLAYLVMMTPIWAYFAATNTLVSNLIGQGRASEVKQLVKKVIFMSLFTSCIVMIASVPFTGSILSWINPDLLLVKDAIYSFYIVSAALLLFSVSAVLLSTVSGSGNTRVSMIIEGIAVGIYLIYVYLVTARFHLSIEIAWASEFVYWSVIGILCWYHLQKTHWQGASIY